MPQPVSFKATAEDLDTIAAIVDRALALYKSLEMAPPSRSNLTMDLVVCHANGNPLDLVAFLNGRDGDFSHDLGGISRHLDRSTGELRDCFVPRFSAR